MKKRKLLFIWMLLISMCFSQIMPMTVEAAKKKPTVKSVELKVNGKKVNSKTITVKKGSSVKVSVKVNPSKAKKSVTYKTSNKKVATVSKGKIKAKKIGTSKITVSVKSKGGKKSKNVWLKVKVVNSLPKKTTKPVQPSEPGTSDNTDYLKSDINWSDIPVNNESAECTDRVENPDMGGYELLRELDYSKPWMSCQHKWYYVAGASRTSICCNTCIRDLSSDEEHWNLCYEHNSNLHGHWWNNMQDFYVCGKCGACWKHTQCLADSNNFDGDLHRIYPSYVEANKRDNNDPMVMMNGYSYKNHPKESPCLQVIYPNK